MISVSEYLNKLSQRIGYDSYRDYLASDFWKKRRLKYSKSHPRRCFACNCRGFLHLHHISYERLGRELDDDIIWLCEECHRNVHKIAKKKKTLRGCHLLLKKRNKNKVYRKRKPPQNPRYRLLPFQDLERGW